MNFAKQNSLTFGFLWLIPSLFWKFFDFQRSTSHSLTFPGIPSQRTSCHQLITSSDAQKINQGICLKQDTCYINYICASHYSSIHRDTWKIRRFIVTFHRSSHDVIMCRAATKQGENCVCPYLKPSAGQDRMM